MVLRHLSIISILVFFSSCNGNNLHSDTTDKVEKNSQVTDGASLFNKNCSSCHGLDGSLGASDASDLTKSTIDDQQVRKTIESGTISGMPRFKETFNAAELDSVVQYIKTLKRN